ncbi:hypothetical protein PHIN109289_11120 [Phaeobacter inhibens]
MFVNLKVDRRLWWIAYLKFLFSPLEIPSNATNYGLEVKRAIRRALYFISSKMVGGLSIGS